MTRVKACWIAASRVGMGSLMASPSEAGVGRSLVKPMGSLKRLFNGLTRLKPSKSKMVKKFHKDLLHISGLLFPKLLSLSFDYLFFGFIMMRSEIFSTFVGCC